MIKLEDITSLDWQIKKGEIGEIVEGIEDINQCINTILLTRKRSDPHRPEFGSDIWQYVDNPVNSAAPDIIFEATTAINRWEPRIKLLQIIPEIDMGTVKLKVEWTFKDDINRKFINEVMLS